MKTIGFIDYYISEWHADNYPGWIKETCEKIGLDYKVTYAWAKKDISEYNGKTTDEWCEEFGIEKCLTVKELCEKSDYIIILSPSNPEQHLSLVQETFPYAQGKRIYIDKTFAPDYKAAKEIYDLAEKYNIKFFSTSALRYASELNNLSNVKSVITTGGGGNMPEYIIHQIEMIVKLLKETGKSLKAEKIGDNQYSVNLLFSNDKQATMLFSPGYPFTLMAQDINGEPNYVAVTSDFFKSLIADILRFFETGEISFDAKQTLEVMKIREAVISAMAKCGEWIQL